MNFLGGGGGGGGEREKFGKVGGKTYKTVTSYLSRAFFHESKSIFLSCFEIKKLIDGS